MGLVRIGPQNLIKVTKIFTTLRVCLVERVEKREDGKLVEGWKSGRVEKFVVWLERKMRG